MFELSVVDGTLGTSREAPVSTEVDLPAFALLGLDRIRAAPLRVPLKGGTDPGRPRPAGIAFEAAAGTSREAPVAAAGIPAAEDSGPLSGPV